jgi:hypothetical protein
MCSVARLSPLQCTADPPGLTSRGPPDRLSVAHPLSLFLAHLLPHGPSPTPSHYPERHRERSSLARYSALTDDCPAYIIAKPLNPIINLAYLQIERQGKPAWIEHGEQTLKSVWQMSFREQNAGLRNMRMRIRRAD